MIGARTLEAKTEAKLAIRMCRLCGARLEATFVDLGKSPLCESFLNAGQLDEMEPFYPLHVRICGECLLAQLDAYVPATDIFTDYAYFSAYSESWVAHARRYTDMITERLRLTGSSLVLELASNDGYLLQHFVDRGIRLSASTPPQMSSKRRNPAESRPSSTSSTSAWHIASSRKGARPTSWLRTMSWRRSRS